MAPNPLAATVGKRPTWKAVSFRGRFMIATASLAALLALTSLANAQAARTVHTNQPLFLIPFSLAPEASTADTPLEAVLFVSGDRGGTWHSYQTQSAEAGKFSFRAGADGEFWFAVRTRGASSTAPLDKDLGPELIVFVDTVAPKVTLDVTAQSDGQLTADWRVEDPLAHAECLSLSSGSRQAPQWSATQASRAVPGAVGAFEGSVNLAGLFSAAEGMLHATATDRAGNETVVSRPIRPSPSANDSSLGSPLGQAAPPLAVAPLGQPEPARETWPIQRLQPPQTSSSPALPAPPAPLLDGPSVQRPGPAVLEMGPPMTPPGADAVPWLPPDSGSAAMPPGSDAIPQNPSEDDGWTANGSFPTEGMPTAPNGERISPEAIRVSRSRKFQLEYVIENQLANGVHRVEVWFTHDEGRTWRHYGDDSDRQSPFVVEVSSDGMYGFRLLVQSREGLVTQPPRSGDPADMWVAVDATVPTAKITSARFGRGADQGVLQIEWSASDALLAQQPVSLFFGESPSGPWRNIATGIANSGRHDWRFDDRVPDEFYLRLEATDQAGNQGVDVLTSPIRRDGFAPHGVIRNVRPVHLLGPP